jgi:hypothetical protein
MYVYFCVEFINGINDSQTTPSFTAQVAHKQPEGSLTAGQEWTLCSLEKISQDCGES